MELRSPAYSEGGAIPARFSCDGEGMSPPLEWSGVPEGTGELVLVVEDPDAPGGTFVHWLLANIDPNLERLQEGWVPPGSVEGTNGFGRQGWAGPCPPPGHGSHRYVFTLLALVAPTDLSPGCSMAEFHDAVQGKELARAQLTGAYER